MNLDSKNIVLNEVTKLAIILFYKKKIKISKTLIASVRHTDLLEVALILDVAGSSCTVLV